MVGSLTDVLYMVPVVLISMSLHEACHAYVSDRLGDPTPRNNGRLTLNPLKHLDPLGTLLFFVAGVGWAKPVPISPLYYKDRKKGTLVVSAAGPLSNVVLAFIASIMLVILHSTVFPGIVAKGGVARDAWSILYNFLNILYVVNISFVAFNLIPIPPLDGSKILAAVLPEKQYFKLMQYENYIGMFFILISFLKPGIIITLIRPIVWFFDTAISTFTGVIARLI